MTGLCTAGLFLPWTRISAESTSWQKLRDSGAGMRFAKVALHRGLKERRVFGRITKPGAVDVFGDEQFEIMTDRDFAGLPAFLGEVEHPLLPGIVETAPARELV